MRRILRRSLVSLTLLAVVGTACGEGASSRAATAAGKSATIDLKFVNHIQAGFPEQDVFVLADGSPDQVVRVEGASATTPSTLAKPAYATAVSVEHDPFKLGPNPLGPFPKGAALGFTIGDWLAATGSGTYRLKGDHAELTATFVGLVPGGLYTLWCARMSLPPNFKGIPYPCGDPDGSQNVFRADAKGTGDYEVSLPPLEPSSKETVSVVALAYHSDGMAYGAEPGEFGRWTHVQLVFPLPAPNDDQADHGDAT